MREAQYPKEFWPKVQEFYDAGNKCLDCIRRFGFKRAHWQYACRHGFIKRNPRRTRRLFNKDLDLVGNRFGRFTVVKKGSNLPNTSYGQTWECRCDCGNLRALCTSVLFSDSINSCGCSKKKKGRLSVHWNGYKDISGTFWNRLIGGARSRGIQVNISKEFCWKLLESQNFKCALSGQSITIGEGKDLTAFTASIDRIDSSLGYTENNIQWLHKDVNRMKLEFPQDKFINLIRMIYDTRCKS